MSEFPPLINDLILKTARGEKTSKIPVWIMRQAGRHLPEFKELRKKHDFFEIIRTPELAAEVTMQPIKRYDLDAAIIFSDILVIPAGLGMTVKMVPNVGPVLLEPIDVPSDLQRLKWDMDVKEKLKSTLDAITLTRKKLEGVVPLLGFSGAPWTLMSYMIEGGGSKTLSKAKGWLYKYPIESEKFIALLERVVIYYLVEQVAAGAQMLQVFESHADLLSPELFKKFCIPSLKRISMDVRNLLNDRGITPVPMVIFAKGAHYALSELGTLGYEVVGIDWTVEPKLARSLVDQKSILQGNLDPCALFGDKESIQIMVKNMVEGFGKERYICNLGHGIYPETPIEGVKTFIEAVHSFSL